MDGHLYESTGLNGRSSLRMDGSGDRPRAAKGAACRTNILPRALPRGAARSSNSPGSRTLPSSTTASASACCAPFTTTAKAGGSPQDGKNLILSDGTATLRFFDPATFREVRHIVVNDHGTPVTQLNELEYIHGQIYANVWHTDRIARISPATGQVLGWIDLVGLLSPGEVSDPEAVLNGIAYDAAHDRLFVTGKLWPKLFEIKIVPEQQNSLPRITQSNKLELTAR